MHHSFQIVQRIAFGLIIGMFLTATVSCQSADMRSTAQEASNSDQGYRLGPEDVLLISVWKDEHLTREVLVRPDGMISFPLVGDVPAEGRTVEELRIDLTKRLIKYIPAVNITVAVIKPLSLAGGLTPFAAENDIKIVRRVMGQQQTFPFRYGDVRKGMDLEQNIILQRGDVVIEP